jgi:hypothetical protein
LSVLYRWREDPDRLEEPPLLPADVDYGIQDGFLMVHYRRQDFISVLIDRVEWGGAHVEGVSDEKLKEYEDFVDSLLLKASVDDVMREGLESGRELLRWASEQPAAKPLIAQLGDDLCKELLDVLRSGETWAPCCGHPKFVTAMRFLGHSDEDLVAGFGVDPLILEVAPDRWDD